MTYQTKKIGVILALVAMVSFAAWPFWKALYFNAASAALQERANQLAKDNPALQTAWEVALADGVVTEAEANLIVKGAGENTKSGE